MEIYHTGVVCETATPTVVPVATDTPTETATPVPPSPTACPIQYQDVPPTSEWYPYVRCLACRKIANGYACGGPGEPCNPAGDGYFRLFNNVTRSQIAKMVSNAAGFGEPTGAQQY